MPIAKSRINLEYYKISNHSVDFVIETLYRPHGTFNSWYFIFSIDI